MAITARAPDCTIPKGRPVPHARCSPSMVPLNLAPLRGAFACLRHRLRAFRTTWGTNQWFGNGGGRMKRREFITLLGSAAAVWPLAAHARQTWRRPATGVLSPTRASIENQRVAAFVQRLRELGWIEGRTVAVKVRWAEGRSERAAEIVAEFVRQKIDVIVSRGTVNVLAAKQATSVIP